MTSIKLPLCGHQRSTSVTFSRKKKEVSYYIIRESMRRQRAPEMVKRSKIIFKSFQDDMEVRGREKAPYHTTSFLFHLAEDTFPRNRPLQPWFHLTLPSDQYPLLKVDISLRGRYLVSTAVSYMKIRKCSHKCRRGSYR